MLLIRTHPSAPVDLPLHREVTPSKLRMQLLCRALKLQAGVIILVWWQFMIHDDYHDDYYDEGGDDYEGDGWCYYTRQYCLQKD